MLTHISETILLLRRPPSPRKHAASTLEVIANRLPFSYVLADLTSDIIACVTEDKDSALHRVCGFDILSFRTESTAKAFRARFGFGDDLDQNSFADRCRQEAYRAATLGKIVVEEKTTLHRDGQKPVASDYETVRILDQDGGELERLHRKIGSTRKWCADRGLKIEQQPGNSASFLIETDGMAVWPKLRADGKTVYASASWMQVIA